MIPGSIQKVGQDHSAAPYWLLLLPSFTLPDPLLPLPGLTSPTLHVSYFQVLLSQENI